MKFALPGKVIEIAQENAAKVHANHPWIKNFSAEVREITLLNASKTVKYGRLTALADKVWEAVAPVAACKKGCAHCCRGNVNLTSTEAELIGGKIGVTPRKFVRKGVSASHGAFVGSACPFLQDETCSIYEHRPMHCRVDNNIGGDAELCKALSDQAGLPTIRVDELWAGYAVVLKGVSMGDIREYFPEGLGKGAA